MEYSTLLEETLEAWEDTRNGIIRELKNIPAKHFNFRPVDGVRSLKELAIHILEVSVMMTGELTREDTNLKRAPWPQLLKMYGNDVYRLRTRDEILRYMKSSLHDGIKAFRNAGDLHMMQFIERFDGKKGTRLAWLNHGIAQEMYHRGQITTYARLTGIKPALTKLIDGDV